MLPNNKSGFGGGQGISYGFGVLDSKFEIRHGNGMANGDILLFSG